MRYFWRELYDAFQRVNGYAMGGIGGLVALAAYIWLPSSSVSMRLLIPCGFVLAVIVITLMDCSYQCCRRLAHPLPKVVRSLAPSRLFPNSISILLTEPSDLFAQGSAISIYSRQKDCEILIGIGEVITVQQNGFIQVSAENMCDGNSPEIWKKILQNNKDEIEALLIKPSLPSHLIQR